MSPISIIQAAAQQSGIWQQRVQLFLMSTAANTAMTSNTTTTEALTGRKEGQLVTPLHRQSPSFTEARNFFIIGSLVSVVNVAFGSYLPFILAPRAASKTYHRAFFNFDPDTSHFDNTIWTYGSDYALAATMFLLAKNIPMNRPVSRTHAFRSRGMLVCYLISVLTGGLAHHFCTSLESQNTLCFRILWTLCVGTVTAASGFMGSIATELVKQDRDDGLSPTIPIFHDWFWVGLGTCNTIAVVAGYLSYQRPACDIFIAGSTQIPPTFYMMAVFAVGLPTKPVKRWVRIMGCVGFITMAPLMPTYPLLVQYTNLSLGAINMILHMFLFIAWGMQGIVLRHVENSLVKALEPHRSAVPFKPTKAE